MCVASSEASSELGMWQDRKARLQERAWDKLVTALHEAGLAVPDGLRIVIKERKSGNSRGDVDFYYYDAVGKRYRSQKEVIVAVSGVAPPSSPRTADGKRKQKPSSKRTYAAAVDYAALDGGAEDDGDFDGTEDNTDTDTDFGYLLLPPHARRPRSKRRMAPADAAVAGAVLLHAASGPRTHVTDDDTVMPPGSTVTGGGVDGDGVPSSLGGSPCAAAVCHNVHDDSIRRCWSSTSALDMLARLAGQLAGLEGSSAVMDVGMAPGMPTMAAQAPGASTAAAPQSTCNNADEGCSELPCRAGSGAAACLVPSTATACEGVRADYVPVSVQGARLTSADRSTHNDVHPTLLRPQQQRREAAAATDAHVAAAPGARPSQDGLAGQQQQQQQQLQCGAGSQLDSCVSGCKFDADGGPSSPVSDAAVGRRASLQQQDLVPLRLSDTCTYTDDATAAAQALSGEQAAAAATGAATQSSPTSLAVAAQQALGMLAAALPHLQHAGALSGKANGGAVEGFGPEALKGSHYLEALGLVRSAMARLEAAAAAGTPAAAAPAIKAEAAL